MKCLYTQSKIEKGLFAVMQENSEILSKMPYKSALADEDFYKNYVNLNSINRKDLQDCLSLKWKCEYKNICAEIIIHLLR